MVITLIIDIILIKDAGDNYLNLITSSRKEGTTNSEELINIATNVKSMQTIRIAVMFGQAVSLLVTWIN